MTDLSLSPLNLMPRIHFGDWVNDVVNWMVRHWGNVLDHIASGLDWLVEHIYDELMSAPIVAVVIVLAVIAFLVRGPVLGILAAIGFLLIDSFDEWSASMETLSLIIVAAAIAIVISVPLGILAAKSKVASVVMRPLLDLMQTLPAFVYLLPALFLFGLSYTTAILATLVFSMPPGIRLTELGIRQVDAEMVEAGQSFGATGRKILFGVQIPLARPTIMAGVNQVIMLSLSMVVIGGMVGAGGLGGDVTSALQNLDIAPGAEAGISVVILAVYLDRVTAGFSKQDQRSGIAWARRLFERQRAATAIGTGAA
ncbi:MAG: ABC transporter permease subunit [Nocardioides sp.]|uniref:ABC transporter permease n=1 Tax=Nocardioides sp. TaxID=35761 RepID=UPI0039E3DF21